MLDIPGVGVVRTKVLQTRSEHDLRIEIRNSYRNNRIRIHSLLRRKIRCPCVSGATRFRTIQIATEAS